MESTTPFTNAASLFDSSVFVFEEPLSKVAASINVVTGASQSEVDFKKWLLDTRKSDPGHAVEASLEDRIAALSQTIECYITDNYNLCIGLSGKDSLCLLANVVNILLDRKNKGLPDTRLDVFTSNTKIDSVLMTNVISELAGKLVEFAKNHNLEVYYHVAQPSLSADYLVGILGGRTIPTTAANRSRKCAIDLKVNVIKRAQKKIIKTNKKQSKETLMLLGKYYLESPERERRMVENQESFIPKVINGQLVASPICMWSIYDVFEFLHRATEVGQLSNAEASSPIEVFADFSNIKKAYSDMSGGCTLSIINEGKASSKPCDARSGCHQCLAVGKDSSAENLIKEHSYLRSLNRIRNYLAAHHNNPAKRAWITRKLNRRSDYDYEITISPDTYNIDHCMKLLQFYSTAHFNEIDSANELGISPRFSVLTLEQVLAIGLSQERYGMASGWEALNVYERVASEQSCRALPSDDECVNSFQLPLQPKAILKENGMTSATIKLNKRLGELLETEFLGTRDVIEAVTDTEMLHDNGKGDFVRAVEISDTGEFHIDVTTEPWLLEQELMYHLEQYRLDTSIDRQHPTLFHVLTRLGILTFNNKGAAARWDSMHRTGAITSIIHSLDTSNPKDVATILS